MKLKYLAAKLKYLERKNIMMLTGGASGNSDEAEMIEMLTIIGYSPEMIADAIGNRDRARGISGAQAQRGSPSVAAARGTSGVSGGPSFTEARVRGISGAQAQRGSPSVAAARGTSGVSGGPSFTEARVRGISGAQAQRGSPSFSEVERKRRQKEELEKAILESLSSPSQGKKKGPPVAPRGKKKGPPVAPKKSRSVTRETPGRTSTVNIGRSFNSVAIAICM